VTPARFTALEYLALIAAVGLLNEEAAEEGSVWTRQEVNAADRALRKVHATLSPASRREVQRRLSR
jgi:hypothetical protein